VILSLQHTPTVCEHPRNVAYRRPRYWSPAQVMARLAVNSWKWIASRGAPRFTSQSSTLRSTNGRKHSRTSWRWDCRLHRALAPQSVWARWWWRVRRTGRIAAWMSWRTSRLLRTCTRTEPSTYPTTLTNSPPLPSTHPTAITTPVEEATSPAEAARASARYASACSFSAHGRLTTDAPLTLWPHCASHSVTTLCALPAHQTPICHWPQPKRLNIIAGDFCAAHTHALLPSTPVAPPIAASLTLLPSARCLRYCTDLCMLQTIRHQQLCAQCGPRLTDSNPPLTHCHPPQHVQYLRL
jgi:hypothetical protein